MLGDVLIIHSTPAHIGVRVGTNMYACEDGVTREVPEEMTSLVEDAVSVLRSFEEAITNV